MQARRGSPEKVLCTVVKIYAKRWGRYDLLQHKVDEKALRWDRRLVTLTIQPGPASSTRGQRTEWGPWVVLPGGGVLLLVLVLPGAHSSMLARGRNRPPSGFVLS